MPSGLVFQSGQIQATNLWDPSAGAWTSVNTTSQYRDYGTGILLPLPPAQVTGLTVATAGSTQLNLSWTANTEPDLNHYNVYRSTIYGFTVNTATDTPIAQPTTNSYSNTGLTASTTYYYKVAAVNNAGLIGAVSIQTFGDTAPTTSTGQHAVVLDGVVQYINGGTGPTLQVGETAGSEASYSIWIKYHQAPSTNPGVFMRRGPTGSFVPYLGTNGVLGCDVHYNTQTGDFFNGGALSIDTWHHIVITHSNTTNTTVLYLDGASVASSAKNDFLLNTGPNRLLMGAPVLTDTTQTNFFPGLVDDARVYNVALSSSEVSSLFTGSNVTRGLVSRWTFDEGTGTVANDSVGINTATLSPANRAPAWTSDVPAALASGGTARAWSGYAGLGGSILGDPAVARNSDGRLEVFVIGSDQAVYHNFQTTPSSNSWSGFSGLGGATLANTHPAAALNTDGQLELFVIGTNSAIYYKFEITPGSSSWTPYTGLGGIIKSNPVVATNSDGRLELFVIGIGTDQALYHNFQT